MRGVTDSLGVWLDRVVWFRQPREPGLPPGEEDLPVGSIALWSMLNGPIPAGWAECDGTQNAPGPDLRSRFIVGRSASRTVDTTGGSSMHGHSDQLAHGGAAVGDHSLNLGHDAHGGLVKGGTSGTVQCFTTPLTHAAHVQTLVHSVTQPSAHGAHGSVDHEPPYYVLVYIQRMS